MCTQSHLLVELNILTLINNARIEVRLRVCDGNISGCWEHFPPEGVSFDQQQQHTRCWNIFSVWWWVVLTSLKPPLNIFLSDRLSHNLDGGWRRRVIKRRWRWALSSPPAFPFHPCPVILCFVGNINWFLILGFSGSLLHFHFHSGRSDFVFWFDANAKILLTPLIAIKVFRSCEKVCWCKTCCRFFVWNNYVNDGR